MLYINICKIISTGFYYGKKLNDYFIIKAIGFGLENK